MKITPEGVRLLANSLQQASEALRDVSVFLASLAVEPEQAELPAAVCSLPPPLVSTQAHVEVPPEAPVNEPKKEEPKKEPVTRQSLRTQAEKLVAQGLLGAIKEELRKYNVTNLSALKPENYEAVSAAFAELL